MKIRLIECSAAVFLGLFAAVPAGAQVVCETGRISALSSVATESSLVVKGGSYTGSNMDRQPIGNTYGTAIWEAGSQVRWLEKYTILKMAYATRSYVRISSSDNNCAGNMDEFTIVVCADSKNCVY